MDKYLHGFRLLCMFYDTIVRLTNNILWLKLFDFSVKENKDSFKKLIAAMKRNDGKNIKPLSRVSNRISSDDEDDLPENKKAESSTNSKMVESISLSDSDDDFVPSPILGEVMVDNSKKQLAPDCSSDSLFVSDHSSKSDKYSSKVNKVPKRRKNDFFSVTRPSNHSSSDSLSHSSQHGSSERLPSPSCIITEHSPSDDSNDSLSLLIDKNMGKSCMVCVCILLYSYS